MSTSLSRDELSLIKKRSFFGGLNANMMSSLIEDGMLQEIDAGETLFLQGDRAEFCFIVLDGWIKLYRISRDGSEAIVSIFSRGQSFAEAAVFSKEVYPVAGEAVSPAKLLRIPRDVLHKSVCEDSEFALSMLASTSMHLKQLVQQVEQLKVHTGAQRLARFLASLCPTTSGSCTIGLPYDKTLIAGSLGMKPESLSRAFLRLRQIGVRVERNTAAISDVNNLRDYANGVFDDGSISYQRQNRASSHH